MGWRARAGSNVASCCSCPLMLRQGLWDGGQGRAQTLPVAARPGAGLASRSRAGSATQTTYEHTYTHKHTRTHACMHARAHARTHARTHERALALTPPPLPLNTDCAGTRRLSRPSSPAWTTPSSSAPCQRAMGTCRPRQSSCCALASCQVGLNSVHPSSSGL